MHHHRVTGLLRAGALVVLSVAGFVGSVRAQEGAPPSGYIRVTQSDDGATLRLEVANKLFRHAEASRPTVRMAGAVHIGDPSFYKRTQALMDGHDVVLFESVKPGGLGATTGEETDEHRIRVTERRLRLLAIAIERSRGASGEVPADLSSLDSALDERFSRVLAGARRDGWDRPIEVVAAETPAGYDLVSYGADGEPGGEGAAADLRFSSQKPLTQTERGEGGPGIQKQLAESLGLVFQPEAMNEGGPNWRNSDMSVDEVQDRLEAAGVDGSALFKMLSGESLGAKMAGLFLKLATGTESSRAMMKVMMVQMLGSAEELMAAGVGAGAGGERLMKVLVEDRNEVVIADLERIIANEPEVRTVGILYGAGHLPDMERRLGEIGYTLAEEQWEPAITVDLGKAGITPEQVESMSRMMRSMIERQRPTRTPAK